MADVILPATSGTGPLLQRDYWAVFADCPLMPSELMAHVKTHFAELPPTALVTFAVASGVVLDAVLDIVIKPKQAARSA